MLALLQLGLCMLVAIVTLKLQRLPEVEITLTFGSQPTSPIQKPLNIALILVAAVYVGLPLLSMLIDAFKGPMLGVISNIYLWQSLGNTLFIGLTAAILSVSTGWFLLQYSASLAQMGKTSKAKMIDLAGSIVYVVPPLVIGTGMFVLLSPHVDVFAWVYPVVIR